MVDECCDGCGRSVVTRLPDEQDPPDLCESCQADFLRELRAGHVADWLGNPLALDE
jgi:hypothetical protein